MILITVEIDLYRHGKCTWKLIFTTVGFDFYYHGKFLPLWNFYFLHRHPYLHLTVLAIQDEHVVRFDLMGSTLKLGRDVQLL